MALAAALGAAFSIDLGLASGGLALAEVPAPGSALRVSGQPTAADTAAPASRASAVFWRLDADGQAVAVTPTLARDVKDPVFALLAGLLDAGAFGRIERTVLDSIASAHGGSRLPYRRIRSLEREPVAGEAGSTIRIDFGRPVELGVPYSILGYHPGSLRASSVVVLRECALGDVTFRVPGGAGLVDVTAQDVHLFGLVDGSLRADVDALFDWLMGDKADDVDVSGVLLLRQGGHRFGVAFGYNPGHQGRSGVFDLTGDAFAFPAPRSFLAMGRTMRERWEAARAQGRTPCGGR
jgi:hypothetical protein